MTVEDGKDAIEAPMSEEQASVEESRTLVARFGMFMLNNSSGIDIGTLVADFRTALEADPRVTFVDGPTRDEHWDHEASFYLSPIESRQRALQWADTIPSYRLFDGMTFGVHVPTKNQPLYQGEDDVPSEDYIVKWDGLVLMVLWEQPEASSVPFSGGQIAGDVIGEALQKAGASAYRQSCNPSCTDLFTHTPLLVRRRGTEDSFEITKASSRPAVEVDFPVGYTKLAIANLIFIRVRFAFERFAELKNLGQRALDIVDAIMHERGHLLEIEYSRAALIEKPWLERLKARWSQRASAKLARDYMAGLWLWVSNLESIKSHWEQRRLYFEQAIREDGLALLFITDDVADVAAIRSVDLSFTQSALENVTGRLDSRLIAAVTLLAGIVGGVAGALAGYFG